jgi:GH35 family endo-1,4-beta-xylanase
LIDRWDVVNEATHFDRPELADRAPKMTNAMTHVGPVEFTRHCFAAARAAGPKATLLINDYRTDPAYEKLIEQLVDGSGKRIYDVIGIQSHMHGGAWPTEKIWEVCERFARFGVPLHFTETTLLSGKQGWNLAKKGSDFKWASTPEGEQRQAAETARFYTVLFSHPAVEAVTWWDFSDAGAWQQAPAGWLRKDMTPKPVFETMKRLIKDEWWTRLKGTTNQAGELRFRGFRGRYHVKITTPEGVKSQGDFKLAAQARWVVHTKPEKTP